MLVCAVLIGVYVGLNSPGDSPAIVPEIEHLNLGVVPASQSCSVSASFTNTTAREISIEGFDQNCSCVSVIQSSFVLAAGASQSVDLKLAFQPSSYVSPIHAFCDFSVSIYPRLADDAEANVVPMQITAKVKSPIVSTSRIIAAERGRLIRMPDGSVLLNGDPVGMPFEIVEQIRSAKCESPIGIDAKVEIFPDAGKGWLSVMPNKSYDGKPRRVSLQLVDHKGKSYSLAYDCNLPVVQDVFARPSIVLVDGPKERIRLSSRLGRHFRVISISSKSNELRWQCVRDSENHLVSIDTSSFEGTSFEVAILYSGSDIPAILKVPVHVRGDWSERLEHKEG